MFRVLSTATSPMIEHAVFVAGRQFPDKLSVAKPKSDELLRIVSAD